METGDSDGRLSGDTGITTPTTADDDYALDEQPAGGAEKGQLDPTGVKLEMTHSNTSQSTIRRMTDSPDQSGTPPVRGQGSNPDSFGGTGRSR